MKLAAWSYRIAGIYGILCVAPFFFSEGRFGRDFPPAVNHPEFYYGFAGVTLAWQVAFLVIASDPARYRPLMPATLIEKGVFGVASVVLFVQQRIPAVFLAGGLLDLLLGALFLASYLKTPRRVFSTSAVRSGAEAT
jgi:hypothetical protein